MSIWHRIFGRTDGRDSAGGPDGPYEAEPGSAFAIALGVLGGRLARADGTISGNEVATFRRVFRLAPDDLEMAGQFFDQARQDAVDHRRYALQAARQFRDRPQVLEHLLDGLFAVAYADRRLDERELDYLREVAGLLGVGEADFARLHARHLPAGNPYTVLGVARDADEMTIRLAHRQRIQDVNPARLLSQGMPQEFVRTAYDKAAALDAALAAVGRERGFTP